MNEQEDNLKKDYVSPIIEPLGTVSNLTMGSRGKDNNGDNNNNDQQGNH